MLARTDSRVRALVLLVLVALVASAIGLRLAWWQVAQHDWLATMALNQLAQQQTIPAERGEIRDANGVLLATSVELQSVFATPSTYHTRDEAASIAAQVGPVLGLDTAGLAEQLASGKPWMWLKRRVDPWIADRIRTLALPGIGMLPETKRVYPISGASPNTTIAAQVLGFVNVDGDGKAGLEYTENSLLAGQPGSVTA
jgi:cell division protein FtsI (penicillin-binding protein 3)